jgi:hypothetical protein
VILDLEQDEFLGEISISNDFRESFFALSAINGSDEAQNLK